MSYSIYHIPGIKIGCTKQKVSKRVKQQGYTKFEILETYDDIEIASDREIELQKQYGYEEKFVKVRYSHTSKIASLPYKRNSSFKNIYHLGAITSNKVERTCPHCGKVGKGNGMFGYHFDRCKLKTNG